MRHLVTGASGFLGAALCRALVESGEQVRGFDDGSRGKSSRLTNLQGPNFELIEGDVRELSQLREASAGCELVWHLAAINGTRNFYERPGEVLDVGVRGTLNAIDAALASHCRRLVLASSSEVYGQPQTLPTPEEEPLHIADPKNPRFSYAGSKLIGELLALHYAASQGLETVVVRPHNVYGPDMGHEHVIPELVRKLVELASGGSGLGSEEQDQGSEYRRQSPEIREQSPEIPAQSSDDRAQSSEDRAQSSEVREQILTLPIQGDGSQTRAFCHIDDAVQGFILAGTRGESGEVYHLGNSEESTIAHLARLIAQALSIQVNLQPGPQPQGGTSRRCPDIQKLEGLGYRAKISLKDGLGEVVAWYAREYGS